MRAVRTRFLIGPSAVVWLALAPAAMLGTAAVQAQGSPVPLLATLSNGEEVPLPELDSSVPSPTAFLGYPLGARFTHYAAIVDYLARLAEVSPRVRMWDYGQTYEGRPLKLVAVSSPDNIERLEEIRRRHLRLAAPGALSGTEVESLTASLPLIVWLGYGVHGNESSSAEAAMGAAYTLAAAKGDWERLLREVIVLIDPLANPDGRERYVTAYEQRRGAQPDPDPNALEHVEPWPGGRFNHYLFDLNRDWAWATQQETRFRLAAYRQWEPQVLLDFHEMGSGSTYFFPPVAEPVHPDIDPRVVRWFSVFGKNAARAFDAQGWLFFNADRYDLFYPAYGDSYPSLRGAIGMTYEMAGGGRAGEALRLPDGSVLRLADRVARHLLSSLLTVRTAAENRLALQKDFVATTRAASSRLTQSVLWREDQPEARALAELLTLHGITVEQLTAETELAAMPLTGGLATGGRSTGTPSIGGAGTGEQKVRFPAGTFVVSLAQPLGNLAEALLRVETPLAPDFVERQRQRVEHTLDTDFYDITAWALPLAYNLTTWRIEGEPAAAAGWRAAAGGISGAGEVGYLLSPQGLASYRFAAGLTRRNIRFRLALDGFTTGGVSYPTGTLFVPRLGNPEDLEARLTSLATQERVLLTRAASSASDSGASLGSSDVTAIRPSDIGLVGGRGVDATAFGSLWHLLDEDLGLAPRRLELEDFTERLEGLEVIVLPDGSGYGGLGEKEIATLQRWVKAGGVLVALGESVVWVGEAKLAEVKTWQPPKDDGEAHEEGASLSPMAARPLDTPGAILKTELRKAHPMAAGLPSPPPTLFQGSTIVLPTLPPQEIVLTVAAENPVASGVVWDEARERLAGALLAADSPSGQGRVILFPQDPAFRLFFRGTLPLFLNAVMYAPSW